MNSNVRINISFKNDVRDITLYTYLQTKRDKSSYIKDLLEKEMKKEQLKNSIITSYN